MGVETVWAWSTVGRDKSPCELHSELAVQTKAGVKWYDDLF
jgi:hypothetical protein